MRKIKVLLVMPRKEVQIIKIPSSIKFIKALIGNNLCYLRFKNDKDTIIIGNKDASKLEFNRLLGKKILLGTFIVLSTKGFKRVSMRKRTIRKYKNMFLLKRHENKIRRYQEEYLKLSFFERKKDNKIDDCMPNDELKKVA